MQNNFNDTINQLKDFNLNPSEQVWKEVESNLDEKKKRRIVAWWWSLPAILLFGIAFWGYNKYAIYNSNLKSDYTTNTQADLDNLKINKTYKKSDLTSIESNKTYIKSDLTSIRSNKTYIKSNLSSIESNKTHIKSNLSSIESNKTHIKSNLSSIENNKTYNESNLISIESNKSYMQSNLTSMESNQSYLKNELKNIQSNLASEITKNEMLENKNVDTLKHIDSSLKEENVIAKTIKKDKKLTWSLAVGGGANYVSRNDVWGQANTGGIYSSGLASTPTTATSNPSSNILSLPKTGYRFSLGVNVEKQLSRKISLQSGLLYQYLENKTIFENSSIVNFLSTATNQEYKNSLHLFELPVNLKYCFNPNSKIQISFLAGGNVSVAFKKNWLFVNDDLHHYEEKPSEINTVLFGLQTGASINFNNKFSLSLISQKNITSVQKLSTKYYLQQVNFQLNIPFKSFKK